MRTWMAVPALLPAVLFLAACGDPTANYTKAKTEAAKDAPKDTGTGKLLSFSNDGSKLNFLGAKVTTEHPGGFDKFSGTVKLSGDDKNVAQVEVNIDMTTLWAAEKGKGKEDTIEDLTKHLKSPDFFDVEKFPTARFMTTEIKAGGEGGTHTVTGNLTMRDVTKSITFSATIKVENDTATAQAKFKITRQDWGIVYKGKADDLIRDDVGLEFDIVAK